MVGVSPPVGLLKRGSSNNPPLCIFFGFSLDTTIRSAISNGISSGIVASSELPICPIFSIIFRPCFASCRIFISVSSPIYRTTSAGKTNSPSLIITGISSATSSFNEPDGTLLPDSGSTCPPSSRNPPSSNSSIWSFIG